MIILVATEKGGVGKSTIAENLAVGLASTDARVVVIDTDPQGSVTRWFSDRRLNHRPCDFTVLNVSGRIGREVLALDREVDYVIVDTGGRDSVELRECAAICDLWLLPALPGQHDAWSLENMLGVCEALTAQIGRPLPAFVVVNRAVGQERDARDLIESLAADETVARYLPPAPVWLSDRVAFMRAALTGASVLETEPKSKAALEVAALLDFITTHNQETRQ